ncbi:MAG: 50S ribosome-binding GTPase, partial [Bacilli bacterium]|nr:50S ribosome-binding GTPase [Bacilli bacterium]
MKVIALVGNPNSGKTTLFNDLTGAKAHVGNWPGVTVEKRSGRYKKGTKEAEIIDLPGIYSLSPYSSEEVVARNYIIDEKPDCLINVIDATNLERNLYLTTQLLECDVPIVIALNMVDALRSDGGELSAEILEQALGVPVIEISALKKEGLDALMEKAEEEAEKKRQGRSVLEEGPLGHLLIDVSIAFKAAKVDSPLFHAVKLIENDENEVRDHPELVEAVESFRKTIPEMKEDEAFDEMVADLRYRYIESHGSPALKKGKR